MAGAAESRAARMPIEIERIDVLRHDPPAIGGPERVTAIIARQSPK
jgi:hypothetical protein